MLTFGNVYVPKRGNFFVSENVSSHSKIGAWGLTQKNVTINPYRVILWFKSTDKIRRIIMQTLGLYLNKPDQNSVSKVNCQALTGCHFGHGWDKNLEFVSFFFF